jgi:hypothetical protein
LRVQRNGQDRERQARERKPDRQLTTSLRDARLCDKRIEGHQSRKNFSTATLHDRKSEELTN